MASKSQESTSDKPNKGFSKEPGSEKSRLPFEPAQKNSKKPSKQVAKATVPKVAVAKQKVGAAKAEKQTTIATGAFSGIPVVVSKRMTRRMGLFCGIPTSLGMLTFIISYLLVSQHIYKLPTVAVLLVSLGFFGLGVLGLSYGALSASWDDDRVGTWLGWSEFRTNFGRTIESWKAPKSES